MTSKEEKERNIETKLVLHGASSNSSSHAMTTIDIQLKKEKACTNLDWNYLVYASHGIINLATRSIVSTGDGNIDKTSLDNLNSGTSIVTVKKTLRSERNNKDSIITCLTRIDYSNNNSLENNDDLKIFMIAAGYSNGGISIWYSRLSQTIDEEKLKSIGGYPEWNEIILVESQDENDSSPTTTYSIADISGIYHHEQDLLILSIATAHGLKIYQASLQTIIQYQDKQRDNTNDTSPTLITIPQHLYFVQHITECNSLASVLVVSRTHPYCLESDSNGVSASSNDDDPKTNVVNSPFIAETLLFCGTALPKNNKVWVYSSCSSSIRTEHEDINLHSHKYNPFFSQGHLTGHEDWITCLAWRPIDCNSTVSTDEHDYFLASGSHDAKIRLWKFHPSKLIETDITTSSNNDNNDSDNDDDIFEDDDENEARMILTNLVNQSTIIITLEALLIGHEESVTSLSWRPSINTTDNNNDTLCIVSSSMDKAILLWSPDDDEEGIWLPNSRVGSAGGILGGSIGSSLLGFLHVAFWKQYHYDGTIDLMMIGMGYGGSVHFWEQQEPVKGSEKSLDVNEKSNASDDVVLWEALPCLTGHFKGVSDLDWEPVNGEYLMTVSYDQTCRLWAELTSFDSKTLDGREKDENKKTEPPVMQWMEIGRPQVHGYDLNAIACLGGDANSIPQNHQENKEYRPPPLYRFVSGADEKQLRAFDAPTATLRLIHGLHNEHYQNNNLHTTHKQHLEKGSKTNNDAIHERVERAYIPSLGLSNKGMIMSSDTTEEGKSQDEVNDLSNSLSSSPSNPRSATDVKLPLERDLGVSTLWPEVRKLYGHSSELVCLASTFRKLKTDDNETNIDVLVASACKARDIEHASIRIWDVERGICLDVLKGGHRSTVASLTFSSDGFKLASSGKDRRLCIWVKNKDKNTNESLFTLAAAIDSAHKRIVWSVSFCPHDSTLLASGGRDGFVKIWKVNDNEGNNNVEITNIHRFEPYFKNFTKKVEAVTAVSFAPIPISCFENDEKNEFAILAVGLENGLIELWKIPISNTTGKQIELLQTFKPSDCHIAAVKTLAWRPYAGTKQISRNDTSKIKLTLASCGLDHGVRIFDVYI